MLAANQPGHRKDLLERDEHVELLVIGVATLLAHSLVASKRAKHFVRVLEIGNLMRDVSFLFFPENINVLPLDLRGLAVKQLAVLVVI